MRCYQKGAIKLRGFIPKGTQICPRLWCSSQANDVDILTWDLCKSGSGVPEIEMAHPLGSLDVLSECNYNIPIKFMLLIWRLWLSTTPWDFVSCTKPMVKRKIWPDVGDFILAWPVKSCSGLHFLTDRQTISPTEQAFAGSQVKKRRESQQEHMRVSVVWRWLK